MCVTLGGLWAIFYARTFSLCDGEVSVRARCLVIIFTSALSHKIRAAQRDECDHKLSYTYICIYVCIRCLMFCIYRKTLVSQCLLYNNKCSVF